MFAQVITGTTTDAPALRRRFDKWRDELQPGATGFLGSSGGVTEDGRFVVMARFESEESARRNSERPEQGTWWAETETLIDNPQFADSSDVTVHLAGAPDGAGFVQVMRGRIADADAYDRVQEGMAQMIADMNEARPDVLGSVTVRESADRYTDVVYFTSEAAAREGEAKELPPEVNKQFDAMMSAVEVDDYLDLRDPWIN